MRDIGHFIGGTEVKGASGRQGDVFNPNTGEVQARAAMNVRRRIHPSQKGSARLALWPLGRQHFELRERERSGK